MKIDAADMIFIEDLTASGRGGPGIEDYRLVSELRLLLVEVEDCEDH